MNRWGRLFEDVRPTYSTLALYRIGFGIWLITTGTIPDLRWIGGYPQAFYEPPPGLSQAWGTIPGSTVTNIITAALLASIAALTLGWRTPWASILVTINGLISSSVLFSVGKIDHTAVLWFTPALLAGSGWGNLYSLDAARNHKPAPNPLSKPSGAPIVAAAVMIAVAFTTAAAPKLAGGWLNPNTQAARSHFEYWFIELGRDRLAAATAAQAPWWAWETVDWATVAFETSALAALAAGAVAHRWWIATAVWFHLAVALVMNIGFIAPLGIYPLFLLPVINPKWAHLVGTRLEADGRWLTVGLIAACGAVYGTGGLVQRSLLLDTFHVTALAMWVAAAGLATRGFRPQRSTTPPAGPAS